MRKYWVIHTNMSGHKTTQKLGIIGVWAVVHGLFTHESITITRAEWGE